VSEHNEHNPAAPIDYRARPARLADGRLRLADGTTLPKPTPRFTGDAFDLDNLVEVPDSSGNEIVDEYGEYRSMAAVVRDAKAASRLPLRGEYPVTTETVVTPADRREPSEGDLGGWCFS